jgi:hypothetical protein
VGNGESDTYCGSSKSNIEPIASLAETMKTLKVHSDSAQRIGTRRTDKLRVRLLWTPPAGKGGKKKGGSGQQEKVIVIPERSVKSLDALIRSKLQGLVKGVKWKKASIYITTTPQSQQVPPPTVEPPGEQSEEVPSKADMMVTDETLSLMADGTALYVTWD